MEKENMTYGHHERMERQEDASPGKLVKRLLEE